MAYWLGKLLPFPLLPLGHRSESFGGGLVPPFALACHHRAPDALAVSTGSGKLDSLVVSAAPLATPHGDGRSSG